MGSFHYQVQVYCDRNDNHDLYYWSMWKRRDDSYELTLTNHKRLVGWALPMPL